MTRTEPATRIDLTDAVPIEGLHVRFLTDDSDFEPLSALVRECHAHDDIPWLPSADNLRLSMRREGIDPARDVVLVEVGRATHRRHVRPAATARRHAHL